MNIFLHMHTIPPRQRATLARRLAAGLPPWAAARGSNLPAEEVGDLMGEAEFRELVGGWAEILDMAPEARKQRLERLAHMVVEQKLADGCPRTALLVQRSYARKRDPVVQLAKRFAQLCELDRARAERLGETPPAAGPPRSPIRAAVGQAQAAAAMRAPVYPDDAALYRQAGALRREMFSEQVLFAAAAVPDATEIWRRPLELWEVDAIEAAQVAAFAAREAERAGAEKAEAPPAASPAGPAADPAPDEDNVFRDQTLAAFARTFAGAPLEFRALLETFTPEQRLALIASCWPEGEEVCEILTSPKAAQGP